MNTPLSNIARVLLLTVGLATAGISFAQQGAQSPTPQKVESVNIMDVGRAPNATSQAAVEPVKINRVTMHPFGEPLIARPSTTHPSLELRMAY